MNISLILYGNISRGFEGDFTSNTFFHNNLIWDNPQNNIYGDGQGNISYNLFWDENISGEGLPSAFGEVITVNANGDSSDTWSNLFMDPLFVNPPLEVDSLYYGWETNLSDSTVTFQLLPPSDWEWNQAYIGWDRDYNYYADVNWFDSNQSVNFTIPDSSDSTYISFEYNYSCNGSNCEAPYNLNHSGNIEIPEVEEAMLSIVSLQNIWDKKS